MSHFNIFCFHSYKMIFNTCILCQILHSEAISFYYITAIPIFTTVQEWRAGIQSRSVRKIFCICSRLPLPTAIAATLAKAKRLTHFYSVAPLLEKWFACFPTSGDGLHFLCFSFWAKSYLLLLENEFTRAVILERWTESEWRQEKKHHVTLSEESGIGYRQKRI